MVLSGQERREQILKILKQSQSPIAGTDLANQLHVSRQVIVQDMALIRANGLDVISTNRGYILHELQSASRVFKVVHTDEQAEEELNLFVDFGGKVEDVFVYHKVYGVIKVPMNMKSRRDVQKYMEEISIGKSKTLKNITSDYHYHTITAEDEHTLDMIQEELGKRGFLAKLQNYEPVDFWGAEKAGDGK